MHYSTEEKLKIAESRVQLWRSLALLGAAGKISKQNMLAHLAMQLYNNPTEDELENLKLEIRAAYPDEIPSDFDLAGALSLLS